MENEIISRIKAIRKDLKLSQSAFAEKLGYTRGKIENIELGRVAPTKLFLQQISSTFNIDLDWLETGDGDPEIKKDDMTAMMDFAVEMFHDKDLDWIRRLCEYINALSPEERADVSRYVKGAAGAILSGTEEKEQD